MRRITPVILTLFAGVVLFLTVFGNYGLIQLRQVKEETRALQATNEQIQQEILEKERDIAAVKHDPFTLEQKARESLGLARSSDIIYLFPETEDASRSVK